MLSGGFDRKGFIERVKEERCALLPEGQALHCKQSLAEELQDKCPEGQKSEASCVANFRSSFEDSALPSDNSPQSSISQNPFDEINRYVSALNVTTQSDPAVSNIAKQLLAGLKILKPKENPETVLKGNVVDAYQGASQELVIIFLETHREEPILREIAAGIDSLASRGINLVGLENNYIGYELVTPDRSLCKIDETIRGAASCRVHSNATFFGAESPSLHGKASLLSIASGILAGNVNRRDDFVCTWVDVELKLLDNSKARSDFIAAQVLTKMGERKTSTAVLSIGGLHLQDLQPYFRDRGISYIAVAVPSYKENIQKGLETEQRNMSSREDLYNRNCQQKKP